MTLQDILSGFTGQQAQSGANPAGGATTGYAPQAGGIGSLLSSPLALALLRGYFTAIASPKLSGWGTALGRGGAAAIDQFGQTQYQNQLEALNQAKIAQLGGNSDPRSAAASIRQMAGTIKGPAANTLNSLADAVEKGAIGPEQGIIQATGVAKQATGVQAGIGGSANVPYVYDKATGQMKILNPQVEGEAPAGTPPPSQPAQPAQDQQVSPDQKINISPEMAPQVKQWILNAHKAGYSDAEIKKLILLALNGDKHAEQVLATGQR